MRKDFDDSSYIELKLNEMGGLVIVLGSIDADNPFKYNVTSSVVSVQDLLKVDGLVDLINKLNQNVEKNEKDNT